MRRSRGLGVVLGLILAIFISHYFLYWKLGSPYSQKYRDGNFQKTREPRRWRANRFSLEINRDFKIEDIIQPLPPGGRELEASKPVDTGKPLVDAAIEGQSKQEPRTENQGKPLFGKAEQQPSQTNQGNRVSGKVEKQRPRADQRYSESRAVKEQPAQGKQEIKDRGKVGQQVKQAAAKVEPQQHKERYLIYLCDDKAGCYGLADRQRAMVATYYLAEVTGRRFGLIMTSPANLRDFYEPNVVKWDLSLKDLPKNASMIDIKAHGRKRLHLETVDFNAAYPQDIVLLRTNHVFWHETLRNPIYNSHIPAWARVHPAQLIARGWLRLMRPTPMLRASLNKALMSIAEKIQEEAEVWTTLEKTNCCIKMSLPSAVPVCAGNRTICSKDTSASVCCDKLRMALFAGCPELRDPCSRVETKACADHLSTSYPKRWDTTRLQILAHNFCTMPPSVSKLSGTVESIRNKKGFDFTDMNLVCAHIRIGHSKTFPFETVSFNKQEDVKGVWDFLKGYAQKGYHMYLASDAQEVKDEAKAIFGERLHMSDEKIVHIDRARDGKAEEAKAGLLFALTEQLLLTTACHDMVRSHSGFSLRATEIRQKLTGGNLGHVYRYHDGIVE